VWGRGSLRGTPQSKVEFLVHWEQNAKGGGAAENRVSLVVLHECGEGTKLDKKMVGGGEIKHKITSRTKINKKMGSHLAKCGKKKRGYVSRKCAEGGGRKWKVKMR